jgi:antitoxin MazE
MKVQVSQWGNSVAVRLPKSIAEDLRVAPGSEVEMWMEGSDLRMRPVPPVTSHRLEDLLAQINGHNIPDMEDWPPVGAEVINDAYSKSKR